MRFNKILAISTCLLLSVPLAACGNTANTTTSDTTSSTADNTTITTAAEIQAEAVSYESKLFDTSYVHVVDVTISDEDWADLRENPLEKTKYKVSVTIDGETVNDVSFATKGNTSLSSVASDPDSDRYSFKINFGKYVDDQTYYGLDKLNLNNIYADATYMKDYISYYIFNNADVISPLTSFVELKINGESFGLYLAIEDVNDSYLDRTGYSDSELYKPESEMLANIGQEGKGADGANNMPTMPDGAAGGNQTDGANNMPTAPGGAAGGDQTDEANNPPSVPDGTAGGTAPNGFGPGNMPDNAQGGNMSSDFDPDNMPEGFDSSNVPSDFDPNNVPSDFDPNNMPEGFDMGGMTDIFSNSSSSASLKYIDDNIDSYADIFDNAETKVTDEDKQEVISALKLLSEGKADEALDVTEVINYFVAHNFVLNYDSYTGTMLHNYYLMETDGKLSVIPWDYNLAFGAFSGAQAGGSDATSLINCGIDSPLSGASESDRPLWAFITSNESYLEQYHEAYQKLIDFINTGALENEINRIYEMIKPYVENDNSAFYTLSEFEEAHDTLLTFCKLRAESIAKQLSGELSTVTSEQDAAAQVDASNININSMGSQGGGKDMPGGNMFGNINDGNMPSDFDPSSMQGGMQGTAPSGFDPSSMPGNMNGGGAPTN